MTREAEIDALTSEVILIDGPVLAGFAAAGLLDELVALFDGRLCRSSAAGPELVELSFADERVPLDLRTRAHPIVIPPGLVTDDSLVHEELGFKIEALRHGWQNPASSPDAIRSGATSYMTAHHRRIPLITHRREIIHLSRVPGHPRRPTVLGAAEVLLFACRGRRDVPHNAWDRYVSIAGTIAGESQGWRVPDSHDDFVFCAEEEARKA
ncbi:MAG: hypothetical protein ABI785_07795 [Gemmatimonadales bacterium]